jgi:hypothetical protein
MRNHLERLFQGKKCHKQACQKNQELVKENIQININKLRDKEQIIPELFHKNGIIQGEVIIYLDDAGIEHLTLLVIPKSNILLV